MGADTGQGIDVGDAVMHFLADGTQLDAYLASLDTKVPAAMEPPKAAVADLTQTLGGLGTYFGQVGKEGELAGEEIAVGMKKASFSMKEAKGEIGLLGEATGVHLPRHVRSFVAELPGVGVALEAAFSATAVLFLIEALVEGTKKLTEWISETFIYTEEMKKMEESTKLMNAALLPMAENLKKTKEELKSFGLDGSKLTRLHIDELNESIKKNEAAFRDASNVMYFYEQGLRGTKEQAAEAEKNYNLLFHTLEGQRKVMELLNAQLNKEMIAESNAAGEALIVGIKTQGEANFNLIQAQGRVRLAFVRDNYGAEGDLKRQHDKQMFDLELQTLQTRLALLQRAGDSTLNQQTAVQAQIEALLATHKAKLLNAFADLRDKIAAEVHNIPLLGKPIDEQIITNSTEAFASLEDSAKTLGISLSVDVLQNIEKLSIAYQNLKNSGSASMGDLLRAQIALLNAQKTYATETGQDTKQINKDLQHTQDEYDKLTGKIDKTKKHSHDYFVQWQLDMKNGVHGMDQLGELGKQAFNTLGQSIESAFASAILAQQGFGEALLQATSQALAALASQALVEALFDTAKGFAALALHDHTAAHNFFTAAAIMGAVGGAAAGAARGLSPGSPSQPGGGSNPQQPATQAAAGIQQGPVAAGNVPRFAAGGLITGPTLAVLGETAGSTQPQSEAAIPLENPDALRKIGAAIGAHVKGNSGTVIHVQGLISPDNLVKVIKQINTAVEKNDVKLTASNAQRLTKKVK
jgi:hypothetical protein